MELKFLCAEMIRTGTALNRQPTEMMLETYFMEFQSWENEQFAEAMRRCRQELDFFPTIHQIRERFPRRKELANRSLNHEPSGYITQERKPEATSLEANVSSLTDDEILSHCETAGLAKQTATMILKRFRKDPESKLTRGFIKDMISPKWNDHNERRVTCRDCNDSEFVEVYTSRTCLRARMKTLKLAEVRTWVVICRCQVGKDKPERKQQNKCEAMMMKEPFMLQVGGTTAEEMFTEVSNHYKDFESEGHYEFQF
jgi:hypothetical protein